MYMSDEMMSFLSSIKSIAAKLQLAQISKWNEPSRDFQLPNGIMNFILKKLIYAEIIFLIYFRDFEKKLFRDKSPLNDWLVCVLTIIFLS